MVALARNASTIRRPATIARGVRACRDDRASSPVPADSGYGGGARSVGTAAVAFLGLDVETIGSRFGGIPSGLPDASIPTVQGIALIPVLIRPALTVAMLGAIESLMSAVVADRMSGDRHNPNIELVAQGIANIASPIFGGLPATGAIARTATNIRSGARTPVAGMMHAVVLLIILRCGGAARAVHPHARARGDPADRVPTTWGSGTRSRSCSG